MLMENQNLILLDDFMSELDKKRIQGLFENIKENQVIITCTDSFKINNASSSFSVSETEQLVYVLQRRAKPICKSGSNAEKMYDEIKKVLREIISDEMNDYEKTKAIHDWLVMNVIYDQELADLFSVESDLKKYNGFYLEGVFLDHSAVCEGIAKAFAAMANIEGIPCVVVTGKSAINPNGPGHAWNKIYVDGNWYVIDATSDGTIVGENEVLSYEHFMISEAIMKEKYICPDHNILV